MPDGMTLIRPEHSPLGGSSAERWINCVGSVGLTKALGPGADEEDEYNGPGRRAHELAAHCLDNNLPETWEASVSFEVPDDMANAVQVYLNYMARYVGKRRLVEYFVEFPVFHPDMYSRLDAVVFDPEPGIVFEIIDYKHGEGVIVDVEGNVQEHYYGFGLMGNKWPADLPRPEDSDKIKLTIIQPRGFHPAGPIRSIVITAGELRKWAYEELRPAMQRAASGEATYKMGPWCQFCPAKKALVCPEQRALAVDAANTAQELLKPLDQFNLAAVDDEWLGFWYAKMPLLDFFKKEIRDETKKRVVQQGKDIPGAKRVFSVTDRVWKPEAMAAQVDPDFPDMALPAPIEMLFGEEAWEPRKLRSPKQIEDLGAQGKAFVAEYAMKPKGELTIAPLTDKRPEQKPLTNEEVFKDVIRA